MSDALRVGSTVHDKTGESDAFKTWIKSFDVFVNSLSTSHLPQSLADERVTRREIDPRFQRVFFGHFIHVSNACFCSTATPTRPVFVALPSIIQAR